MKTLLLFFAAIVTATCLAHAQNHYRVTNLGVLSGDIITVGYGLNDLGDVVGSCASGKTYTGPIDPTQFPFLYHAGKITHFAPNGLYGFKNGIATAINNKGEIGGEFYFPISILGLAGKTEGSLAYVYNGNFKPLTDGHHSSYLNCVNNLGVFGGSYTPTDQPTTNFLLDYVEAFVFVNNPLAWGTFTEVIAPSVPLPQLYTGFYNGYTNSINDLGQAVGYTTLSNDGPPFPQAWLYFNGKTTLLTPHLAWFVNGINSHGQMVGQTGGLQRLPAYTGPYIKIPNELYQNAVFYQNGVIRDLPYAPVSTNINDYSSANAINDAGTIVGYLSSSTSTAVRWLGYQIADLNKLAVSPGVKLTNAIAINRSGQILCNGTLNGATRAFLLTPQ